MKSHYFTPLFTIGLYIVFCLSGTAIAAQVANISETIPKEGKAYQVLKSPVALDEKDKGVTVQEFFSYQCEHCYEFSDDLHRWKKSLPSGVKVVQVPVLFTKSMKAQALLFYTLQSMGLYEKVSPAVFKAIQREGKKLDSVDNIAHFMNERYQVPSEKFKQVYNSLDVVRSAEKAYDLIMSIRLQAIPAMLIGGRYLTNPQMAGSPENMLKVVDYLIKKIKAEKKG